MATIVQYPSSILKTPCEPLVVGSKLARQLADQLRVALRENRRDGIGLSAPQLGESWRIFVLHTKYLKLKCSPVFINPVVISQSLETDVVKEGCLSFPDSVGIPIRRSIGVTVTAFDENGAEFTVNLNGMAARCCLHELAHLAGRTIIDDATPAQRKKAMKAIAAALRVRAVGR